MPSNSGKPLAAAGPLLSPSIDLAHKWISHLCVPERLLQPTLKELEVISWSFYRSTPLSCHQRLPPPQLCGLQGCAQQLPIILCRLWQVAAHLLHGDKPGLLLHVAVGSPPGPSLFAAICWDTCSRLPGPSLFGSIAHPRSFLPCLRS